MLNSQTAALLTSSPSRAVSNALFDTCTIAACILTVDWLIFLNEQIFCSLTTTASRTFTTNVRNEMYLWPGIHGQLVTWSTTSELVSDFLIFEIFINLKTRFQTRARVRISLYFTEEEFLQKVSYCSPKGQRIFWWFWAKNSGKPVFANFSS